MEGRSESEKVLPMAPLPLFYASIVVLDREAHRATRLKPADEPFAFAAGSHLIPALLPEFAPGCRDMPILFLEEAGAFSPLFMVGMRSGSNDFVDAAGRWNGLHAPAYLRRYPFIGGEISKEQQIVCIDGGFAGLNAEEGEALFGEDGEPSEMLQRAAVFVRDYAQAGAATAAISEERLNALPGEVLVDLRARGYLAPIYAHLVSIANFGQLGSRAEAGGRLS